MKICPLHNGKLRTSALSRAPVKQFQQAHYA
jgi:hypothetical protein